MGTRSTISILKLDGTVEQIYCHWDGDISGNGVVLFLYYKDSDKVKDLMDLGNISSLDKNVNSDILLGEHNYNKPQPNVTVAYYRDRGENGQEARKFNSFEDFIKKADFQEYDYIFKEKNEKWFLIDHEKNKLLSLITLIKKSYKDLDSEHKEDFDNYLHTKKARKEYDILNKEIPKINISRSKKI